MPETVLPEDKIVGEVAPAVLNLDRVDHAIQDRARTDIGFRPFAGTKQAERMIAQARLVALPYGGKTFLEARKGMAGLCRNQRLEAREGFAEGARINGGSSGDGAGRAPGTGIPIKKPVHCAGAIDFDTQCC